MLGAITDTCSKKVVATIYIYMYIMQLNILICIYVRQLEYRHVLRESSRAKNLENLVLQHPPQCWVVLPRTHDRIAGCVCVCVCMYVCMYLLMSVCMHVCIYVCDCVYMYEICMICALFSTHTHARAYVYIYIYTYIHICVYVYMCV